MMSETLIGILISSGVTLLVSTIGGWFKNRELRQTGNSVLEGKFVDAWVNRVPILEAEITRKDKIIAEKDVQILALSLENQRLKLEPDEVNNETSQI
jgi:hypothetical protein